MQQERVSARASELKVGIARILLDTSGLFWNQTSHDIVKSLWDDGAVAQA
jgi:hypothetical protein